MKTEFESIKAEKDDLDLKEQKLRIELLKEQIEEARNHSKMCNAIWLLSIIITTIIILVVLWKLAIAIGIISITADKEIIINALRVF